MDAFFAILALGLLALFLGAVLFMGWATGVWGVMIFAALGGTVYALSAGGHRLTKSRHDPRFNAFQQPLGRKR